MKREIKFRAWHISQKRFIDINGMSMWFGKTERIGTVYGVTEQGVLREYDIDEVELEQFTGLKDASGVDIYEGDILLTEDGVFTVNWNTKYASFCINKNGWMFSHFFDEALTPNQCEVIGNIHQNPELIKQKS
jgi:hypothetical protein